MQRITKYVRRNLVAYLALFVALTGSSAYAAGSVFSEDIVNGEVKTPDLAPQGVTDNKLAPNAVSNTKVLDNSLKGDDIDESSLALDFQGTAKVISKRTSVPAGTSGQTVLDVPGFGEVRIKTCSGKSTRASFLNDTAKNVDAFADVGFALLAPSTVNIDPLFEDLAPGEELFGSNIEGTERATFQVGFGSGRVATIVVMSGGDDNSNNCIFQAQAVID
jgi:hypothetical protein